MLGDAVAPDQASQRSCVETRTELNCDEPLTGLVKAYHGE
jgi:hypothetical protein